MPEFLEQQPGLLFVVATLLPLASFVLLLLGGAIRCYVRKSPEESAGATIYQLLGGDRPTRMGAYVATGAIFLSFVLCLIGSIIFLVGFSNYEHTRDELRDEVHALHKKVPGHAKPANQEQVELHEKLEKAEEEL